MIFAQLVHMVIHFERLRKLFDEDREAGLDGGGAD